MEGVFKEMLDSVQNSFKESIKNMSDNFKEGFNRLEEKIDRIENNTKEYVKELWDKKDKTDEDINQIGGKIIDIEGRVKTLEGQKLNENITSIKIKIGVLYLFIGATFGLTLSSIIAMIVFLVKIISKLQ
jgi:chromosome segregation ATPase